jgi:glycerol kinase
MINVTSVTWSRDSIVSATKYPLKGEAAVRGRDVQRARDQLEGLADARAIAADAACAQNASNAAFGFIATSGQPREGELLTAAAQRDW